MQSIKVFQSTKLAAAALCLAALALTLYPRHAGAAFHSSTNPLPALSGAAAIEHLKQQGLYASLTETMVAAQADALIGEQTKLTANDGAAEDRFGFAVAIIGNTAIVGAPEDEVSATNQGSAYVFVRSGSAWTQQARLSAIDGATNHRFGRAVAIINQTVLVGVPGGNAAYVFVRSGVTWSQQAKLTAADGATFASFGGAVALSGETALIGAFTDDIGAQADQGSAYVFTRSGTMWSQQAKLTAADGATDELFGQAVALSGDTIAVGVFHDDIGAKAGQGSAYVFTRNGVAWSQQQKLTASDGSASDFFGYAVALNVANEDLAATIYSALGIDYTTKRYDDPFRRGFEYVPFASEGAWYPVLELFGRGDIIRKGGGGRGTGDRPIELPQQ